MSLIVPTRRNTVTAADIRSGSPVRAVNHLGMGKLTNWLLGRGAQVVPPYLVSRTLVATTEYVFHFRITPRYQCFHRLWTIWGRAASDFTTVRVEVPSAGSPQTIEFLNEHNANTAKTVLESVTQAEADAEITIALTSNDENLTDVVIGCVDVPRAQLTSADGANEDRGVDTTRLNPGQPVDLNAIQNISEVGRGITMVGRRVSLIQWAVPPIVSMAATTTSQTYVDLWTLPLPVLARKDLRADVTGGIEAKFYAWHEAAGSGEVRITTSNSGITTSAVATVGTTPAWIGAPLSFSPDCEDMASADGRQTAASPAWDEVQVQYRSQTVAKAIYLASASVWEA